MGVATWIVWAYGDKSERVLPIAFFFSQLVLNVLWSFLFFGLHRPDIALIEIVLLWVLIFVTLILFWRVRSLAGAFLIPYLLWVGFATALNYQLWMLNR
jgi:tryptophan-rich sensory protein